MTDATILYIEDNADNRTLIRRILTAEGYVVIEAGSAPEALQAITTARPNLILMDINMPEVDGYTLTSRIREMQGFESIPIVALTANVMRGDREKVFKAGCDGYIEKPIDVDRFIDQVAAFLP